MPVVVETDHHVIEFDSKKTFREFKTMCKELHVDYDYYMFEFDVDIAEDDDECDD